MESDPQRSEPRQPQALVARDISALHHAVSSAGSSAVVAGLLTAPIGCCGVWAGFEKLANHGAGHLWPAQGPVNGFLLLQVIGSPVLLLSCIAFVGFGWRAMRAAPSGAEEAKRIVAPLAAAGVIPGALGFVAIAAAFYGAAAVGFTALSGLGLGLGVVAGMIPAGGAAMAINAWLKANRLAAPADDRATG